MMMIQRYARRLCSMMVLLSTLVLYGSSANSEGTTSAQQAEARRLFSSAFELLKKGQSDAAIIQFERGLAIEPNDFRARYLLADAYFSTQQFDKAAENYATVVKVAPASANESALAEAKLASIAKMQAGPDKREGSGSAQMDIPKPSRPVGPPATPSTEELINRELLNQYGESGGLNRESDARAQVNMARQAMVVRALFEDELKRHPITDEGLKEQYERFKRSMGANEYKVRHILLDSYAEAKSIIDQLNGGADFVKLAKEKSKDPGSKEKGGELDWGPSARYVKPFADAVQSQPKGKVSVAPVKTDFGYHVIEVEDVRPLKLPEFSELKEQFRKRAERQLITKLVTDVRSKAKVDEQ